MADAQLVERINQAYIRPIRTVLAIDDEFPEYGNDPDKKDLRRAKALWEACRKRGLLFDVDGGETVVKGDAPDHLLKSDLVVLDYHLQPEDERHSLSLLSRFAESDHASLVVVYTKDKDIASVRAKVAAHLRGRKPLNTWLEKPEDLAAWDAISAKERPPLPATLIDAFLGGRIEECKGDTKARKDLTDFGVAQQHATACLLAGLETAVHGLTKQEAAAGKPSPVVGKSAKSPWVYVDNLFVVCVSKDNVGEPVFQELLDALCEWNPNFMYTSLAFARAELARGGFKHEREALRDTRLQAGWLYHAWAGSPEEAKDRLRTLFERVVSGYANRVLESVIEFGSGLVPPIESPAADMKTLRAALGLFYDKPGGQERHAIHLLNSFLVTELSRNYIETGTIFVRKDDADMKHVYVCVTPACDLVPRPPKDYRWESQIHPSRPIIALRGEMKEIDDGCLMSAEEGKHIFLMIDAVPKTIVLMDASRPVPILEWFVVENMGAIGGMEFDALEFVRTKAEAEAHAQFNNKQVKMRVLGQVRALYASKLQQYAGQHISRIGVDFVELPKPEKKEKPAPAPKAAPAPTPASNAGSAPAPASKPQAPRADAATTTVSDSAAQAKPDSVPPPRPAE